MDGEHVTNADLLLTDVMLRGKDRRRSANALRARARTQVVYMSAMSPTMRRVNRWCRLTRASSRSRSRARCCSKRSVRLRLSPTTSPDRGI